MQHRREVARGQRRRQRTVSGTVLEVSEVLSTAMQRLEGKMESMEEKIGAQTKEIARLNTMLQSFSQPPPPQLVTALLPTSEPLLRPIVPFTAPRAKPPGPGEWDEDTFYDDPNHCT
jgi:hypothetical protein